MKIEIEKKITITPDEGVEPVIAFNEILSSESKAVGTVLDMIKVGQEQQKVNSDKALTLAIDLILNPPEPE